MQTTIVVMPPINWPMLANPKLITLPGRLSPLKPEWKINLPVNSEQHKSNPKPSQHRAADFANAGTPRIYVIWRQ